LPGLPAPHINLYAGQWQKIGRQYNIGVTVAGTASDYPDCCRDHGIPSSPRLFGEPIHYFKERLEYRVIRNKIKEKRLIRLFFPLKASAKMEKLGILSSFRCIAMKPGAEEYTAFHHPVHNSGARQKFFMDKLL
jgi:hypothetical protein